MCKVLWWPKWPFFCVFNDVNFLVSWYISWTWTMPVQCIQTVINHLKINRIKDKNLQLACLSAGYACCFILDGHHSLYQILSCSTFAQPDSFWLPSWYLASTYSSLPDQRSFDRAHRPSDEGLKIIHCFSTKNAEHHVNWLTNGLCTRSWNSVSYYQLRVSGR